MKNKGLSHAAAPYEMMFDPISPWQNYVIPSRIELLRYFCEAGVTPAVHDTLVLVLENKLEVPRWLAESLLAIVKERLATPNNERVMYKSRMRHFYRWRQVRRLLDEGVKWDDVYACASKAFEGTDLECGEEMIKYSYKTVNKALKDPRKALQYYTTMKATRILTETQHFTPPK
jgi:hypothetical protein